MVADAVRSKPVCQDTSVVSTTAISTPGNCGALLRITHMMAIAATPMASVGRWVSPTSCKTPQISLTKDSERPIGTPISLFTCDSPMMIAAALVKPTITGWERKFTTTPSLNTPSTSWKIPTSKASMMARATKACEPGAASGASDEAVSSEATATGPVPSCFDEPHSAATATGRKAA
jgi:hypothetical protein